MARVKPLGEGRVGMNVQGVTELEVAGRQSTVMSVAPMSGRKGERESLACAHVPPLGNKTREQQEKEKTFPKESSSKVFIVLLT